MTSHELLSQIPLLRNLEPDDLTDLGTLFHKQKVKKVNTARTIYGKKAFVQFENTEKARDLATKIGML